MGVLGVGFKFKQGLGLQEQSRPLLIKLSAKLDVILEFLPPLLELRPGLGFIWVLCRKLRVLHILVLTPLLLTQAPPSVPLLPIGLSYTDESVQSATQARHCCKSHHDLRCYRPLSRKAHAPLGQCEPSFPTDLSCRKNRHSLRL